MMSLESLTTIGETKTTMTMIVAARIRETEFIEVLSRYRQNQEKNVSDYIRRLIREDLQRQQPREPQNRL
ncbi:MAG: hypothetical protein N5P05_004585 [Chroococcopsis gigantea SAG 12.99]|nr:hypothetical protein [Chroococcopsis gigantea SAG 12.99]